jgi:hypothetical protein
VALQWKAFIRDGSQSGVFRMKMPDGSLREFTFHAHVNFVPGLHCSFITPAPESQHASGFCFDVNLTTASRNVEANVVVPQRKKEVAHHSGKKVAPGIIPFG